MLVKCENEMIIYIAYVTLFISAMKRFTGSLLALGIISQTNSAQVKIRLKRDKRR